MCLSVTFNAKVSVFEKKIENIAAEEDKFQLLQDRKN